MNQVTPASLSYPLSVFNKNSTLIKTLLSNLISAVLTTTKGDESPGSSHMGVIGALVIFFQTEVVQDKLHSP